MSKINISQCVARSVIPALAVVIIAGCDNKMVPPPPTKAHNLKYLGCKSGDVDINVDATQDVLTDPDDRLVVVCSGQNVYWKTTNSGVTIKIDFKDQVGAKDVFTSNDVSVASDPNNLKQTKKETAKGATKKELQDYQYSIAVVESNGTVHRIDPHIIPM